MVHGATERARLEQLDMQYRSNVRSQYALVQTMLSLLRKQIVFINSSTATRPSTAGVGQHVATKCALRAIADSLRDEDNAKGIRVASVYPGRTAIPGIAVLFEAEGIL